ncbi:thiol-disulfide oxidoreductase [Blastomonas aquatica]|uniref:Thiol-disulfide oxidoreductase n=2 Tax=Blastomonas aquatica TaxID=1510276 RepID=A0ABQ1J7W5_9SPHN|nr:thiol-disulfide oxidoreductase [Blastomonas aquatica]
MSIGAPYMPVMNTDVARPAEAPSPAPAQGVTVWFDGACPLCLREIALMRRLDRRGAINFVDVSSPDALCPIDQRELLARFHARENGVLLSGAAAFAAMWRAIPVLKPLGWAARNRVVLKGLEWLYLRFLVLRPRLQQMLANK